MIVTQAEIDLVNNKKRALMLLPVEYGKHGERKLCPIEEEASISLQPALFVKGTKVTITFIERRPVGELTDADGRHLGYAGIVRALEAFHATHGDHAEVWAAAFVLGDRTAFYRKHAERYLKRKGVSLTRDH
jgi:hypothetical protein